METMLIFQKKPFFVFFALFFFVSSCSLNKNDEKYFNYIPPQFPQGKAESELVALDEKTAPQPLRVMTYNTWQAGLLVDKLNGPKELGNFFKDSNVDIIGLQEDASHGKYFADRLGYNVISFDSGMSILTSFEVLKKIRLSYGVAALLKTNNGNIFVVSIHLPASNYGPFLSCYQKKSPDLVEKIDMQTRGKYLFEMMEQLETSFVAENEKKYPFIFMGDFNTPSHQDWPYDKKNPSKGECDFSINFPITKMMEDYHFIDSYRTYHKDVENFPAYTWSPLVKFNENGLLEIQDRIDFIFIRGSQLKVLDSSVKESGYSDHSALLSVLGLSKASNPVF